MGDDVARGIQNVATQFIPTEIIIGIIVVFFIIVFVYKVVTDDENITFH